ncbi:MAG: zinc ribbon domain-containing protein [Bacillota bacterium]
MKSCPNCGNAIDDDATFCTECGHNLTTNISQSASKWVNVFPLIGIIFALVALVLFPPVFGGLGIFMGFQTKKYHKDSVGTTVIIISAICLIAGMIIGYISFSNM